jgi:hypothetical protein
MCTAGPAYLGADDMSVNNAAAWGVSFERPAIICMKNAHLVAALIFSHATVGGKTVLGKRAGAMEILGVVYVVYDKHDASAGDALILLATDNEHEALGYAKEHKAFAYRYEVTDDEDLINEKLIYEGK